MTPIKLIGREEEIAILNKAIRSNEAELVAVIGRRRVGKTFLIRSTYSDQIKFEMAGIQNGTLQEQIRHFTNRLNFHFKPLIPFNAPSNWLDAFHMLSVYFENQDLKEKIVLFFDELPWIASRKSGFLKAFGIFWNTWASQNNVVVVICGSAASWMIQKVVKDRGGLHNRITRRIQLQPFNLRETEDYLKSRSIQLDRFHIIQLYMAMGGIPHYLKEVEGGQSAAENIDRIFFSKNGLLNEEFNLLYPALFENAEKHISIIRILAQKWRGMSRKEIIQAGSFSNGGTITKIIDELEQSGFITPYYIFGKKKNGVHYRLTDEYSIFYLKFVDNKRLEGKGMWKKFSQSQTYKIWRGYAFESLGLKHIPQIKQALNIAGIYSEGSIYRTNAKDGLPGIQIDLLIDRNDDVINFFELKFHNAAFIITKTYAQDLRNKVNAFKLHTKTRKQVFISILSTFGLHENEYSNSLVDKSLTIDDLF